MQSAPRVVPQVVTQGSVVLDMVALPDAGPQLLGSFGLEQMPCEDSAYTGTFVAVAV